MRETFRRVVASILWTTACAWAQTSTGTIIGTVSDGSGAVIAAARIAITNTGTNAKLEVVSNEEGSYTAPLLPPGSYSVAVTAQGFKSFERSGIQLRVQQQARVAEHAQRLFAGQPYARRQIARRSPLGHSTSAGSGL